ncbi:hypothetical protein ACK1LH_03265 [Metabacillus indicus]|uniref:hypothetical protein n=1 Tax=Metabacillus indicus TaxID=246786 RepID=UPI003984223C
MFAGFNLKMNSEFLSYSNIGNTILEENKEHIEKEFDSFLLSDGSIDGTKMQNDWFPEINADVFISHSHADKEKAIAVAGWLYEKFGLTVFIDSCVWGYAANLLKKIDDIYCKNKDSNTYNYEKRNFSTSHVYMMLSTALTKMIDKTECVLFLNTPNSIVTNEVIKQTKSPWIYYELAMTQSIRKKDPIRFGLIKKGYYLKHAQVLDIKYKLDIGHLCEISQNDLQEWEKAYNPNGDSHALDVLYEKHDLIDIQVKI